MTTAAIGGRVPPDDTLPSHPLPSSAPVVDRAVVSTESAGVVLSDRAPTVTRIEVCSLCLRETCACVPKRTRARAENFLSDLAMTKARLVTIGSGCVVSFETLIGELIDRLLDDDLIDIAASYEMCVRCGGDEDLCGCL